MYKKKNNYRPSQKINEKLINIRIGKKHKKTKEKDEVQKETNPLFSNFIKPIEDFLNELEKTRKLAYNINGFVSLILGKISEKIDDIVERNIIEETDEYKHIRLTEKEHEIFHKSYKEMKMMSDAPGRILHSFFISMLSLYEDFLANQIRIIYKKYPQKLKNEKQLVYEDFLKMNNLDEIQDYFVENSIRDILSRNTLEQIKAIQKLLDIKNDLLLKNMPIKELVEISSRRNIIVHNKGKINKQYINNCSKIGTEVSEEKIGDMLKIDKDYFMEVFNIMYESTMIVSYLVGRKVFGGEKDKEEKIDSYFNSSCLELILPDKKESIALPLKLLKFVISNKAIRHKELDRILFIINYALCHKIIGKEEEMHQILNKEDWSGCQNWLQFGYYTLIEDYKKCMKLFSIVSIPSKLAKQQKIESMHFDEKSYRDFPIFYKLRKEKNFQKKYKEVFGEELQTKDYK